MGDFDILSQNSTLIKFDIDSIIEIVNMEVLKKSEKFIPSKKTIMKALFSGIFFSIFFCLEFHFMKLLDFCCHFDEAYV